MRLGRIARMHPREIAGRSRQELAKLWERRDMHRPPRASEAAAPGAAAAYAALRSGEGPRFFPGVASGAADALLAERTPEQLRALLATAERALGGRFDLLGYRDLCFGRPLDWRLDPVSGRRAPIAHWTRIDPLDGSAVGDHKVVWELSRQQWLMALGVAHRVTGEERYARGFATTLRHWRCANPRGMGINWTSSLEAAFRIVSWTWALHLLQRSQAVDADLVAEVRAAVLEHATHVARYLSFYFSPNTHLTGEALGLFYAGTLFPDLPRAARWRRLGARILVEQSQRQVLEDGVYFEQSTGYQRYTVEFLLHFLILSERQGRPAPPRVSSAARRMLDFLVHVRRPDGRVPQIGDADGGSLLPLPRRTPEDFRGVFSVAAALFERPDYAWAAGGATPELLLMLGAEGLARFERLEAAPPRESGSRLFSAGGYAAMRDGWQPDANQLLFDVGPLGCPVSSGHGHADLLSIQCSAFGEAFLVDPGTFVYTGGERDHFRGTAAHSTVSVDGLSQATPAGPFAWRSRATARLRRWICDARYDFADAEHDTFGGPSGPIRHRRRVLFVKRGPVLVVDDIVGESSHRFELRFQFAQLPVSLGPDLWLRARGAKAGLLLRSFASVALAARVVEGSLQPLSGWISPDYGRCRPAPMLVVAGEAALPVRVVTLLVPTRGAADDPPAVYPLFHAGSQPIGLHFPAAGESICFTDEGPVFVRPGGRRPCPEISRPAPMEATGG